MATLNFHPGGYRDVHDKRDRRFAASIKHLPPKADLSRFCGAVYSQYRTQTCSANALASALTLDANQRDEELAPPSRLFMYYNARPLTNTQATDSGTTIRNVLKPLRTTARVPSGNGRFSNARSPSARLRFAIATRYA